MSAADTVSRAQQLYDSNIRSRVEPGNIGRYIAIDAESGDYEVGDDYLALSKLVRARQPHANLAILRASTPP